MKTPEDYSLKYTLQERDYYYLNKWYYKKIVIIIIAIFLFFYILNITMDYKNISAGNYKNFLSYSLFFPVLSFISISILNMIIKRRSKLVYKNNKQLRSAIELKINDDAITDLTDKANVESSWKDMHKIIKTGNYFYLMQSKTGCIILPVREIKDQKLMDLIKLKAVSLLS